MAALNKRFTKYLLLLLFVVAVFLISGFYSEQYGSNVLKLPRLHVPSSPFQPPATSVSSDLKKLHLLLPSTQQDVNLCKTILTAAALGYPTPRIIGWGEALDNTGGLLGDGSHVVKINGVLNYLEGLQEDQDNELVLMMDAYDIWFQLPPEVLIKRYHQVNTVANQRLHKRLGSIVQTQGINQTIVFGSGKRCAPNQMHTVACYPIPEPPLPHDLYGGNTDTIMGRNKYTSQRQKWLNSGYVIGPVKDMREMFRRAKEKVDAVEDHPDWDNGSGGMDYMYRGSDQSIFNIMLGEQEFQREAMRRKYKTSADDAQEIGQTPTTVYLEGTKIDDPLNPSFTHEPFEPMGDMAHEFGIGLDYFSQLGQQTVNSEEDSRYIRFNGDMAEQTRMLGHFGCPRRITDLAQDIESGPSPWDELPEDQRPAEGWRDLPLLTNMCLDSTPVMIHHNGNKDARNYDWPHVWMQPHARQIMGELLGRNQPGQMPLAAGAFEGDRVMPWEEFCPGEMDGEIYLDSEGS